MRHTYHRCQHCRAVFLYQSSGQPTILSPNQSPDDRYCLDCHRVIQDALVEAPIRFERIMEPVTDPGETQDVLAEHERLKRDPERIHFGHIPTIPDEERAELVKKWALEGDDKWEADSTSRFIDEVLEAAKPKGTGVPISQHGSSLFKHEGGKIVDTMHTAIFTFKRRTYHVSTWHKNSHPPEIKVEMERNTATGELVPWRRL